VTTIGDSAFERCSSLTKITFPDGVKTIGKGAFSACTKLTEVNMSTSSVIKLEETAFSNCLNLVKIALSDILSSIEKDAIPLTIQDAYYCGSNAYKGEYSATKIVKVPSNYTGSSFGSASVNKIDPFPYPVDYHMFHHGDKMWIGCGIAALLVVILVGFYIFYKRIFISINF